MPPVSHVMRPGHHIGKHRRSRGRSPGPGPVEHQATGKFSFENYGVIGSTNPGQRVRHRHQGGFNPQTDFFFPFDYDALGPSYQFHRVSLSSGLGDVFGADLGDACNRDIFNTDAGVKSQRRQNRDFRRRVVALHVGGGVGFGIPQALGFGQGGFIVPPLARHLVENKVRGSVHDP